MRIIIFAIAAVLLCSAASAEKWMFYAEDLFKEKSYFDADTLQQNGNVIKVWVQRDYSGDDHAKPSTKKMLYKIDCAEQSSTLLSYVFYKFDSSISKSRVLKVHEQEAQPVVPGSVDEELLVAVCRKLG